MEKIILSVDTKIEEALAALFSNEIDKMVQIINFDPSILFKNSKKQNCLLLNTIKIDNVEAFIKVNELINIHFSIFESDLNFIKYNLDEMIVYVVELSSFSIFQYLVEKHQLNLNDIINVIISKKSGDKIFEDSKFPFIEYFLINHGFKYKIKKKLAIFSKNDDSNEVIHNNDEKDKNSNLEADNFSNEEDFIYFNCLNSKDKCDAYDISKYVTQNHNSIKNIFNKIIEVDNTINTIKHESIKDKDFIFYPSLFQLGFIKCMKYLLLKYKSPYNPEFSDFSEEKILKFMS